PDDNGIGVGISREHRKHRRLAHARAGEDSHPLALATRHKGIQRAYAEIELSTNAGPRMGGGSLRPERITDLSQRQRALAVDRPAESVGHTTEPPLARVHKRGLVVEVGPGAKAHAVEGAERH